MEYSSPGLVLEYRRAILVLGLDLRLPVLELDSYSAKVALVASPVLPESDLIDSIENIFGFSSAEVYM